MTENSYWDVVEVNLQQAERFLNRPLSGFAIEELDSYFDIRLDQSFALSSLEFNDKLDNITIATTRVIGRGREKGVGEHWWLGNTLLQIELTARFPYHASIPDKDLVREVSDCLGYDSQTVCGGNPRVPYFVEPQSGFIGTAANAVQAKYVPVEMSPFHYRAGVLLNVSLDRVE